LANLLAILSQGFIALIIFAGLPSAILVKQITTRMSTRENNTNQRTADAVSGLDGDSNLLIKATQIA
jgi:hypothetical protein